MENYTLVKPEAIKRRKRVGCGTSSGHGKTSCRGSNGQKSRSGGTIRPGFEGGQMPLHRRIPKRGFNNIFKKDFQIVNLGQIAKFEIKDITNESLFKAGLIQDQLKPVKLLANGEIGYAATVNVKAISEQAKQKVEKAGGKIISE